MNQIVIGAGFGDEGKGMTVSHLLKRKSSYDQNKSLVVRFNGGHQAGHNVVFNDKQHIFSNYGAGTLQGVPTYWSEFCTFYPIGVHYESNCLREKIGLPKIYVNKLAPITTIFDLYYNEFIEKINQHGSCGVGFGATIERHEKYYKIYYQDLFNSIILKAKLSNVIDYYANKSKEFISKLNLKKLTEIYLNSVNHIIKENIITEDEIDLKDYDDNIIFEGAQGILLDMDFGFFPNVTRSNTTSKNAMKIINDNGLNFPQIYYVTRSYQTRHGNGFMSSDLILFPEDKLCNINETNVEQEFQGKFRRGILDIDLLNYALECDDLILKNYYGYNKFSRNNKNLMITCLDHTGDDFYFKHQNETKQGLNNFLKLIKKDIKNIFCSYSNSSIKKRKI